MHQSNTVETVPTGANDRTMGFRVEKSWLDFQLEGAGAKKEGLDCPI